MTWTARTARHLAAGVTAALVLTACGGADGDASSTDDSSTTEEDTSGDDEMSDDEMSDEEGSHRDDMSEDEMSDDEMSEDDGEMSEDEDAAGGDLLALTATAADGSTFALGDFAGGPVLVETFATWCGNCRRQLGDTQEAAAQAGDDAVFLALSVETSLDPAELERYAAENGFDDIRFGVVDDAGLSVLQEQYGGAVLTPPSTPKFRIDADGSLSELQTGPESTEEILESLGA